MCVVHYNSFIFLLGFVFVFVWAEIEEITFLFGELLLIFSYMFRFSFVLFFVCFSKEKKLNCTKIKSKYQIAPLPLHHSHIL